MSFRGAAIGGFGVAFVLLLLPVACGSSKRAGNGAECFVANDCVDGLVCVPQKDGTRKCSDNLDSIVGEIPPEAGPPAPDTGAPNEAGATEAGASEAGPEDPPDAGNTDQ